MRRLSYRSGGGGNENKTATQGVLGIGAVGGMARQDRMERAVRREGGISGISGGNSLLFVGKESGHRRTYKKGRGGQTGGERRN